LISRSSEGVNEKRQPISKLPSSFVERNLSISNHEYIKDLISISNFYFYIQGILKNNQDPKEKEIHPI
jgi:hypothetical protein